MITTIPRERALVQQHLFEARYRLHGQSMLTRVKAGSTYEVWLIVKSLYPMACITSILASTI
jgi:hypothetical protein